MDHHHQKDEKPVFLKSKNPHPVCAIYKGVCISKENYIGETKRIKFAK